MTKPIVTHESAAERFFTKVDKTAPHGCWLWTACCFERGYGAFRFNGKQVKAHRFSYELANGPIPEGLRACHRCDEFYKREDPTYKRCVNPAHLFVGTDKENQEDMTRKQRGRTGSRNGTHTQPETIRRGVQHHNAKLNAGAVREIRRLLQEGHTQKAIGKIFNVTDATVNSIDKKKTWTHVPTE